MISPPSKLDNLIITGTKTGKSGSVLHTINTSELNQGAEEEKHTWSFVIQQRQKTTTYRRPPLTPQRTLQLFRIDKNEDILQNLEPLHVFLRP